MWGGGSQMISCNRKSVAGLVGLAVAALAGSAQGQLLEEYASGFLHGAVGGATLGPVDGRRLPVNNIGSSGQDGVEIQLRTLVGGGTGVSVPGLFGGGGSGGSFRTKYKGWDGTIKGRMEVARGPAGYTLTVDFTPLGAIGVEEIVFDGTGVEIGHVFHGTPTCNGPIFPDCPPPSVPTMWYWRRWDSNQNKYVYQWMWTCLDHVTLHGEHYQDDMRVYIPILPVGVEDMDGQASMTFQTALPQFDVMDAEILTFGVSSSAVGSGHLTEECDDSGSCDVNARRLRVNNIGSSGQDGVEIKWPKSAAGGSAQIRRSGATWDIKENKKFYDDQGVRMMEVSHVPTPGTSDSAMTLDFSTVGDGSCTIEFYDGEHHLLGSDSFVPTSGATVTIDPNLRCPVPSHPYFAWDFVHQVWVFAGCTGGFDMVLPSGGMILGAMTMEIAPNQSSTHRLGSAVLTGSDQGGDIIIESVTSTGCPADVTHDDVVDLADFFQFFNDFDQTLPGADIDGSGEVDLGDFFLFLNAFDRSC